MWSIKEILTKLVNYPSVTPHDEGCQHYILELLQALGFKCQNMDNPPVSNLYAQIGNSQPLFIFAGHTDVVPVGDRSKWATNPFALVEQDGFYYGRGVADMKGSIAAMLVAAKHFVDKHSTFQGSLGFLITSGEEGNQYDLGTPYVMNTLKKQGLLPRYCVVGEPSSTSAVGDVIKIGRRGSLSGQLTLHGKQGHVAYPHLAENPIHSISKAVTELVQTIWDKGNDYFPPTTFQITHIQAGGQANNIIPGELTLHFNFRYSTEQTCAGLKHAIENCFLRHQLHPHIDWQHSGEPFLTAQGRLLTSSVNAITHHTQQTPELSTSGGTSDGRFIAPFGVEVIELGPTNATIHQVNERVGCEELEVLAAIYLTICEELLL